MTDLITQIGVGGAFAVIMAREAYKFAKDYKNNGDSDIVKRKEFEEHKKAVVYKDNCALVKEFNKERFDHIDAKLESVERLIRNGGK
jgi:hypothetical protein